MYVTPVLRAASELLSFQPSTAVCLPSAQPLLCQVPVSHCRGSSGDTSLAGCRTSVPISPGNPSSVQP